MRGIIFDMDGTLVDSNDAHAKAFEEAFIGEGIHIGLQAIRPLIGMGGDKLVSHLLECSTDDPRVRRINELKSEIFSTSHLPGLRPFPMAKELVQSVIDAGVAVAIASAARKEELTALLRVLGIQDLVKHVTSASDAEHSKPDPEIVVAALRKLNLSGSECVMLGDTPYDMAAAQQAGVPMIGFRCGGWDDDAFLGALAVYDGPWEYLVRFEAMNREASSPRSMAPAH